jgi:hypothetical protein
MKTFDFSHLGGEPLCQDDLDYLQTAWKECFSGLAEMGGASAGPFIVSGCAVTRALVGGTIYNYSIAAGWVYYNGEMVAVNATGPIAIDESLNAAYIQITPTSGPLTYFSGAIYNVINDNSAALVSMAIATADSGTLFALAHLKPFGREAAETHIVVATGGGAGTLSGDIYYRKNYLNNTLQMRGVLATSTPSDFAAWPGTTNIICGAMPDGYRPKAYRVAFNVNMPKGGNVIKDINGTYFSRLNGTVETNGNISIDWIKPDGGIGIYIVEFNFVMSLD